MGETDTEDLHNETKTILNSLVIPHPRGLSLKKLCDDYKELEGKDVPFRQLGFSSLSGLLRSMSDVIEMRTESDGSLHLYSIENESTEHIINMVNHQSKKKLKTPNSKRGYPNRTSTPMDPRVTKRQKFNDSQNDSFNGDWRGNDSSQQSSQQSILQSSQQSNGSMSTPYHEMSTEQVESLVAAIRMDTPTTTIEKAKNGVDSKIWSDIFDVQKVTDLKELPIDTNGLVSQKATLRHPMKIGEYSLKISSRTGDRQYISDASELKYLHTPPKIADVSLDLTHGYEMVSDIHWGKPSNAKIDELLSWISQNRRKFMASGELVPQKLNTDFVCYRGLLAKLMVSPYENNNRWLICATKFRGTIYLCEFHEVFPPPDDYYNKLSFGGFRFEQYLTSYESDIPPDPNDFDPDHHEYCTVMRTRLMNETTSHSLAFGAELDCVLPHVMEHPGHVRNFVELKTTKMMSNEYQYRNFIKYKLLKWWAQSYLVGVPTIVCGYKDNKNVVKNIEHLKIESFPDLSAEFWSASVCLNFLNKCLTHFKELVTIDDPNVVYQFAFQPQQRITCTRLTEPGEFQILPNWYIKEMSH